MASDVIVHGLPETHAALRGLESDLHDLTSTNLAAAGDIARAIAAAAPKVTGRLAGSFHATATREAGKVESDLVYAPVIEYGWAQHNIEPAHYVEEGVSAGTPAAERRYDTELTRACRKAEA